MVKKSLGRCLQQVFKLAAVQTARELGDRELLERFVAGKDEAAFAVLVERHCPLVLGVCRRSLGNLPDAEDACQAAFLVLAQKAASIRKTTALSSWLHGVAARVAAHLKRQRRRRGKHEQQAQGPAVADPAAEVSWREVQAALDEELERLPDHLRAPLILCYLDGLTRDAAAQQLGLSIACLHGRLERGRKALCAALTRRGVTLSAALVATALGEGAARAGLPPTAVLATARAAVRLACGRALEQGLVTTRILSLAQEVARTMSLTRLKLGVLALLCAGLLATALGGSLASVGAGEGAKAPPAATPPRAAAGPAAKSAAAAAPKEGKQTIRGRVLGPDGKPVAGARVYLLKWNPPPWLRRALDKAPPKVWARTDRDGRFSFQVATRDWGELFVTAAGHGPGWVIKPANLQQTWPIEDDQLVRLARDDVPVRGRLLDLQGEPVAGATIRVFAIKAAPDGSLDKFIRAVKDRPLGQRFPWRDFLSSCHVDGLAHFFPPITTDRAGRFQLKGVGRDRVVAFTVEAPAIEMKVVEVMTRPGVGILRVLETGILYGGGRQQEVERKPYYPPTFTHVAAPGRVLSGVVRDRERKRIAGAIVRAEEPIRYPLFYNRTTTDKQGRYRLTGLPLNAPLGMRSTVVALPPDGEPYLALRKRLPRDKETKQVPLDFDLPRGVWLEGQVKNKVTGRGVPAQFHYHVFPKEKLAPGLAPQGPREPGYYRDPYRCQTDEQGKFRTVVALDRGLLGVVAVGSGDDTYRIGVGADKIKGGRKDPRYGIVFPIGGPLGVHASFFNTLVEIRPARGDKRVRCDVLLEPARTLTIEVRRPDGKPLAGCRAQGQWGRYDHVWSAKPLPATFTLHGLEPGKVRTLVLAQAEKDLVARRDIKGDERGPVVVTLQPAATVVGRLLDRDGRPLANAAITVELHLAPDSAPRSHWRPFRTDAGGRFRINGLVPGVPYQATVLPAGRYSQVIFDLSLKSGQRKDLGDVKLRNGDSK
jgi:RNA polymerase sigma factor (sigma-70 family)